MAAGAAHAVGAAHDGPFPRPLRRRVRGLPVPALVLNTILATALIPFDATGDPLALFATLALLSTFVYVFGFVMCGQAPRGPIAVVDRPLDGETTQDREPAARLADARHGQGSDRH
jgi:hypothetical protein